MAITTNDATVITKPAAIHALRALHRGRGRRSVGRSTGSSLFTSLNGGTTISAAQDGHVTVSPASAVVILSRLPHSQGNQYLMLITFSKPTHYRVRSLFIISELSCRSFAVGSGMVLALYGWFRFRSTRATTILSGRVWLLNKFSPRRCSLANTSMPRTTRPNTVL
jgi:hypothetical protein